MGSKNTVDRLQGVHWPADAHCIQHWKAFCLCWETIARKK